MKLLVIGINIRHIACSACRAGHEVHVVDGYCDLDLESLAYHSTESNWLVCAHCKNEHIVLMLYDRQWNWQSDLDLEICTEKVSVSSIAKEKLDAVFTQAEIRDMQACQQGLPYTRQNLYRARAKYEKFKKLFGIKIDV